jgi:NAD(P)-dependent dehydrogenase (short-subunit alcohol dehydrogenase family)
MLSSPPSRWELVERQTAGRIVMVSSGLGSLTWNADPNWSFAAFKPLGYNGSKAILNTMTVQLAWELRDTPIKVNTVTPGYTATDLNSVEGGVKPDQWGGAKVDQ